MAGGVGMAGGGAGGGVAMAGVATAGAGPTMAAGLRPVRSPAACSGSQRLPPRAPTTAMAMDLATAMDLVTGTRRTATAIIRPPIPTRPTATATARATTPTDPLTATPRATTGAVIGSPAGGRISASTHGTCADLATAPARAG